MNRAATKEAKDGCSSRFVLYRGTLDAIVALLIHLLFVSSIISSSSSPSFYLPNNTTLRLYAHLHRYNFKRAGQQGPTLTLTAALKRVIKQLLET